MVGKKIAKRISLQRNLHLDIAEIPENIRHCRSLQSLDFSGNPLANK
jgi:Leucine-rich repeat (LRR) protein